MTSEEVILSDRPKDEGTYTKPSEVASFPEPISEEEFENIKSSMPVVHQGRLKIYGSLIGIADASDVPLRVCAHCVRLDLSNESERRQYADLKNEADAADSTIRIQWEEHVKDGLSMVVYLTYFEYFRVVKK